MIRGNLLYIPLISSMQHIFKEQVWYFIIGWGWEFNPLWRQFFTFLQPIPKALFYYNYLFNSQLWITIWRNKRFESSQYCFRGNKKLIGLVSTHKWFCFDKSIIWHLQSRKWKHLCHNSVRHCRDQDSNLGYCGHNAGS